MPYPFPAASAAGTTVPLSGTAVDVTGISDQAKRITIALQDARTNGTANWIVQLGDSGGLETAGYLGAGWFSNNPSYFDLATLAGFIIAIQGGGGAGIRLNGEMILSLLSEAAFMWVCASQHQTASNVGACGGRKSLTGTLDRFRLTTTNGTDIFQGGIMRVLVEG